MKLAEIQSKFSARIMASAPLAALGEPLLASLFDDESAAVALIGNRLRSAGALIQIGYPALARVGDHGKRGIPCSAQVVVLIAESISVAHTPAGLALMQAVCDSLHREADPYEIPAEFESSDAVTTEDGYVLHALTFTQAIAL